MAIIYNEQKKCIESFHLEKENAYKIKKGRPSRLALSKRHAKKAFAGLADIELNHNTSWYTELLKRSKKHPKLTALFYRGTKVTFEEMFVNADKYVNALVAAGVKKGDEIPCCLANTPELVYLLLAANKLGLKLNLFGAHLDKEYLNEILDGCSSKIVFVSDDYYDEIKDVLENRTFDNKVIFSLSDSMPLDPTLCDEYEPEYDKYYHFDDNTASAVNNGYLRTDEFVLLGEKCNVDIPDENDLETEFLVTYTSGSTRVGHPKQIVHKNRSLITSGRFHDSELSGNPEIPGLRGLAHIHSDSNTDVITCISDNLMQGWSVALEPLYSREVSFDTIMINKPSYLNITTSFLTDIAKKHLHFDKNGKYYSDVQLPFLLAAFAVGEKTSKGEERLINKFLKASKAGSAIKIKGLSLPYTTLSIGGGDCEHGGIYYTLWKTLYEKLNMFRLKNREYGMNPEHFALVSCFNKIDDGLFQEIGINEIGLIAANSATTMSKYKGNEKATKDLIITDTDGRQWVSSNVYGYIDELGGVHVKGRIDYAIEDDNVSIPTFVFEDVVGIDYKNILSCSVTRYYEENICYPVISVELQPDSTISEDEVCSSIKTRLNEFLPENIVDRCFIRFMGNKYNFPLTASGKRSIPELEKLMLDGCKKLSDYEVSKNKTNSKELTLYKKLTF